jgi:hypothetical protein
MMAMFETKTINTFGGGTGADGRNDASAHGEYYDDWNPFVAEA